MSNPIVPVHLGIIPDGNRRWARAKGVPTLEGHRRGAEVFKEIALASFDRGVRYLSIYAFSAENWRRAAGEVKYLMELVYALMTREFQALEDRGVRFRLLGSRDHLPARLLTASDELEERTAHFTRGTLAFCLNYGGQQELAEAFKAIMLAGVAPADVTPELVARYLYAPEIPPLDLVIRTSGEQRISGFMLWRAAYAEFCFVEENWPDFTAEGLHVALAEFARRQRRFGK